MGIVSQTAVPHPYQQRSQSHSSRNLRWASSPSGRFSNTPKKEMKPEFCFSGFLCLYRNKTDSTNRDTSSRHSSGNDLIFSSKSVYDVIATSRFSWYEKWTPPHRWVKSFIAHSCEFVFGNLVETLYKSQRTCSSVFWMQIQEMQNPKTCNYSHCGLTVT